MNHALIHRDRDVMAGKPVIRGTRVTVEHILRVIAEGDTIEDILDQYPRLTREGVLAAVAYASDYMRQEGLIAA